MLLLVACGGLSAAEQAGSSKAAADGTKPALVGTWYEYLPGSGKVLTTLELGRDERYTENREGTIVKVGEYDATSRQFPVFKPQPDDTILREQPAAWLGDQLIYPAFREVQTTGGGIEGQWRHREKFTHLGTNDPELGGLPHLEGWHRDLYEFASDSEGTGKLSRRTNLDPRNDDVRPFHYQRSAGATGGYAITFDADQTTTYVQIKTIDATEDGKPIQVRVLGRTFVRKKSP
jgi:hypothetical protein